MLCRVHASAQKGAEQTVSSENQNKEQDIIPGLCGAGKVTCEAKTTGGVGYEDGNKVADYKCYNSGGGCAVKAPSNGKDVFGVELRTTYDKLNGGVMDYPIGTNPFVVNPDSWWHRNVKYNNRFVEELKKVQREK